MNKLTKLVNKSDTMKNIAVNNRQKYVITFFHFRGYLRKDINYEKKKKKTNWNENLVITTKYWVKQTFQIFS